ncbi:MAG: 30S ribosomal protein S12 methylthiotransferase RimO [candidate division WOR-3 bacterium]
MKTYKIVSLGCPKNLVDSEIIMGLLEKSRYKYSEKAQIVIINTCGFISSAVKESEEEILSYIKKKKKGEIKKLVVAGCLVQREKQKLIEKFPDIDLIIGHDDILNIVKLIENGKAPKIFENPRYLPNSNFPRLITTNYYAYLKIGEGCSRNCSFCTIPLIRGKFRSRPIEDILNEVKFLSELNIKEVVLVAQDLTLYGYDLYKKFALLDLMEALDSIENIKWYRLLYVHPDGIARNEDFMRNISNFRVVPYLEVPIQHISDRILRLMNRTGGKSSILRALEIVEKYLKNYTLRTEIIVGFPSESEEEFEELVEFILRSPFSRIGVFPYYREQSTISYSFDNQIDEDEKMRRYEIASQIAFSKFLEFQKNLINREVPVLIESYERGYFYGRSIYDAPNVDGKVILKGKFKLGEIYNVKIFDVSEEGDLIVK